MKKIIIPGLVAGLLMTIAMFILTPIYGLLIPGLQAQYSNLNMFRAMEDPLMQAFFLYPFILAMALSWAWDKSKKLFKEKKKCCRGVHFGLTYWIIATIPGMYVTYTSFQVSLAMTLSWAISGLVYAMIAGMVFAKMNK